MELPNDGSILSIRFKEPSAAIAHSVKHGGRLAVQCEGDGRVVVGAPVEWFDFGVTPSTCFQYLQRTDGTVFMLGSRTPIAALLKDAR